MSRGNPVQRIVVVRYPDATTGQLVPKSYRPGAGDRRGYVQIRHSRRELLGPADERLPDPLAPIRVERREDLAAVAVEHGKALLPRRGLADRPAERVQGADPDGRQSGRGAQPTRRGDADPQARE
jgi:hypothetical protein